MTTSPKKPSSSAFPPEHNHLLKPTPEFSKHYVLHTEMNGHHSEDPPTSPIKPPLQHFGEIFWVLLKAVG